MRLLPLLVCSLLILLSLRMLGDQMISISPQSTLKKKSLIPLTAFSLATAAIVVSICYQLNTFHSVSSQVGPDYLTKAIVKILPQCISYILACTACILTMKSHSNKLISWDAPILVLMFFVSIIYLLNNILQIYTYWSYMSPYGPAYSTGRMYVYLIRHYTSAILGMLQSSSFILLLMIFVYNIRSFFILRNTSLLTRFAMIMIPTVLIPYDHIAAMINSMRQVGP